MKIIWIYNYVLHNERDAHVWKYIVLWIIARLQILNYYRSLHSFENAKWQLFLAYEKNAIV